MDTRHGQVLGTAQVGRGREVQGELSVGKRSRDGSVAVGRNGLLPDGRVEHVFLVVEDVLFEEIGVRHNEEDVPGKPSLKLREHLPVKKLGVGGRRARPLGEHRDVHVIPQLRELVEGANVVLVVPQRAAGFRNVGQHDEALRRPKVVGGLGGSTQTRRGEDDLSAVLFDEFLDKRAGGRGGRAGGLAGGLCLELGTAREPLDIRINTVIKSNSDQTMKRISRAFLSLLQKRALMLCIVCLAFCVEAFDHEKIMWEPKKLSVLNSDDKTFLWSRERFRPKSHHRYYIAGLPNSGTNFAFIQLFQKNCQRFGAWQPPYVGGKHKFITKNDSIGNDTKHAVLVVVKHPLTWITSMCRRRSYFMKINNKTKCLPSPVSFNQWGHQFEFPDLVRVWMDYYSRFRNNASFPVEWVRYEDLLLYPEETTREYCRQPVRKVVVHMNASKSHQANETTRAGALQKYTNHDTILADFTREQLNYVAQSISKHDQDLLSFFGYHVPWPKPTL